MTTSSPAHAWILPKLTLLLAEAEQAGIARDVAVAVILDLIEGPLFNAAPPVSDSDFPELAKAGFEESNLDIDRHGNSALEEPFKFPNGGSAG